jgi:Ca-activated chloride channel family protein
MRRPPLSATCRFVFASVVLAVPAWPPPGCAADSPPGASSAFRIISPRAAEIVSGTQPIEVSAPASDASGKSPVVEILVDGKVVSRLTVPPYQASFEFGSSLASRTITARIVEGPGTGTTAEIRTRGFDPGHVDALARVDLVTLFASVRTAGGKYVTSLQKDAFTVYEGEKAQTISHFAIEKRPLIAAILLDVSLTMKGEPIDAARDAAVRFVQSLAPGDRAMVIAFSDDVRILAEATTDRDKLIGAIRSIQARGGTALYDAIYQASDILSREEGRKVIVLLSDGRDEASSGLEPGSLHTFDESLEKALRSEAILFTIGFGRHMETDMDFLGRFTLKQILERMASDSGGSFHYPKRASALKGAYELIGEELRNQYSLAYTPLNLRRDGAWHPLRVEVKDRALKVFTRTGYYAPKS